MTANSTFIASVERIDMPQWALGLAGTVPTDLGTELCIGEKCLN